MVKHRKNKMFFKTNKKEIATFQSLWGKQKIY